VDPVSGDSLSAKSLVKLVFHRSADSGEFHCPVTYKVFNEHSHIVAVKKTGNVYSQEALQELVIGPKNWRDLLTDEKITRADLITLQDPSNIEARNISEFYHFKKNLKVYDAKVEAEQAKPEFKMNMSKTTERVLKDLAATKGSVESLSSVNATLFPNTVASTTTTDAGNMRKSIFSSGRTSGSLTSTAMPVSTQSDMVDLDEAEFLVQQSVKGRGLVRLVTNHGQLELEVFCTDTPRAAYNFLAHCRSGYYNNTLFHRNIRNFMIQGGDPSGTGKGGQSVYKAGAPFKDEFRTALHHGERGTLAMANRGENTNTSQFYITYRSTPHLNMKHTVFGRVVGGERTLDVLESLPVGKEDRPKEDIIIQSAIVLKDPFQDVLQAMDDKAQKTEAAETKIAERKERERLALQAKPMTVTETGVGKYMPSSAPRKREAEEVEVTPPSQPQTKKKSATRGFDFSGW
jgi:peptidyl-prolyl cis-trans isomerase-like protein 2